MANHATPSMNPSESSAAIIRFSPFELDLRLNELRKNGVRVRLQDQPLAILALLLERHGEVVSRDELRARLWPDRFVDFDHSLNAAIKRLRETLDDPAERPHFIETVPRRGYRFIGSIDPVLRLTADRRSVWRRAGFLVVALTSAAVIAILAWYVARRQAGPLRSDRRVMLAVLPFDNLDPSPDQEYFSDGMTEEIITELGRVNPERLGIIARASAMTYKHRGRTINQVGRDLGVDYVLEGSVQRSGDRVRIAAHLGRVGDQTQIWAEAYERSRRDVFELQGDVAKAVASAVEVKLTSSAEGRLAHARPIDPEAHEAYLEGRYFSQQFNKDSAEKAIRYLQRAIERDPQYAAAYADLTVPYSALANLGVGPAKELYSKAEAAVAKALEIDDLAGEPHEQKGWIQLFYRWNLREAGQEFERALMLMPNRATAHDGYATYLAASGRFDEALSAMERAHQLDPLSLIINADACQIRYFARQFDAAISRCNVALEIDPHFSPAHSFVGQVYEATGRYDQAYAHYLKAVTRFGGLPSHTQAIEASYAVSGWNGAWRKRLELLQTASPQPFAPAYFVAEAYVRLGDNKAALDWLDRAVDERYWRMIFLNVDPLFDRLRDEVRFQALIRRMGVARFDQP